ncbi:HAD family hydrolase [Acidaminobacter sp. JC074]|uniref:HAD family hydrolase n=1 Tax=Acidaminobacter sp. JC074 TaxID=2530199 RepID=UPI001F10E1E1|nr:HAD family hydrolase [Acidaminobacter sp. JC074]MCH4887978.1 HAD family hydrolase [Acidaminobacter sp. JC074]
MHTIFKDKAVVFIDMGNTLLGFHQGLTDDEKDMMGLKNMSDTLKAYGIHKEKDTLKHEFLDVLYGQFHLRESKLIELDVYKILKDFLPLTDDMFRSLMLSFYKPYKDHICLHDGAKELLEDLNRNGKRIGVLSNCYLPDFVYIDIFKSLGLDDYVDSYTFSYTHGIRKPNPELFYTSMNKYDQTTDKMIMIGDGLKPDIYGASSVGLESIWYNHKLRSHSGPENMVLQVKSLKDLV